MATVLTSCKNPGNKHGGRPEPGSSVDGIYSYLSSMPPSQDLLKFYQAKIAEYSKQDEEVRQRLSNLASILDHEDQQRQQLEIKENTILQLQSKLLETKESYLEEKRMRTALEKRKEAPESTRSREPLSARSNQSRKPPGSSVGTKQNAELEYLREQISVQEQCHLNDLREERGLRRSQEKECRQRESSLQLRISEQDHAIQSIRAEVRELTQSFLKERSTHRSNENSWLQERGKLMKKVEFLSKFGVPGAGENTEQRLQTRLSAEKQLRSEIKRLKTELGENTQLMDQLRTDFSSVEKENSVLRAQLKSQHQGLDSLRDKRDTEARTLKERLDKMEKRRRRENEGHQADIRRLRDEIKSLESKILLITSSKSTEKENQRILENIRTELRTAEKTEKREWVS